MDIRYGRVETRSFGQSMRMRLMLTGTLTLAGCATTQLGSPGALAAPATSVVSDELAVGTTGALAAAGATSDHVASVPCASR